MDPILHKFRDKFIEEANGLLDRLEKDLLELENKPDDKELIESAFRAMHTIKGVSGMYGFDFICEFTHHMENIYQSIRDRKMQFNREIFDITFNSIDHIRKLLSDEKLADKNNHTRHNQLMDSIGKLVDASQNSSGSAMNESKEIEEAIHEESTWHIFLRTTEILFFRGISLVSIFKDLAALGKFQITKIDSINSNDADLWSIFLTSSATENEIREVFIFIDDDCRILKLCTGNIFAQVDNKAEEEKPGISIMDYIEDPVKAQNNKNHNQETTIETTKPIQAKLTKKRISVDSSKLDQLMFLVSELINVNSQLNLSARDSMYTKIMPHLEKIDSLARQFRNNALELRLVPLGDTVLRFQRLIRDLSNHLNKNVDFKTMGTETELDKNTIDQLTEPLMHIVRNCIDHGLESPEERIAKGKSPNGMLGLSAYNSGSFVFICVSDDGRGIDVEKVRLKAVEKGILKPTDKPDKKEIFDLIFLPGFSTAQNLTEVSGRGVGMDVVKKRITDLRGEVIIDSEPNVGTTFTLKLQQSLSIIDTLLFTVADNYFTVPISEIEICIQRDRSEIEDHRHTATLPFNDRLIPFIDLRTIFNVTGKGMEKAKIIVLHNNDKELALITDTIVGEHQAVLKPLGKSFHNQHFITSASQLGDGKMAFMLDTNALMKRN